jgi:hypothetical protein
VKFNVTFPVSRENEKGSNPSLRRFICLVNVSVDQVQSLSKSKTIFLLVGSTHNKEVKAWVKLDMLQHLKF